MKFCNPFYTRSFQSSAGHRISGRVLKDSDDNILPFNDSDHDDPNPAFPNVNVEWDYDQIYPIVENDSNEEYILVEFHDADIGDDQRKEYTETSVSKDWVLAEFDKHLKYATEAG